MKATHITVEYAATRSRDFQSVRLGASVEIELEPGETPSAVLARVRPSIVSAVNAQAHDALDHLLFGPSDNPPAG